MVNGLPGTEHADRERILNASTEGCCANDAWRGRLCTYHDGFADGLDAVGVEYTRLAREHDDALKLLDTSAIPTEVTSLTGRVNEALARWGEREMEYTRLAEAAAVVVDAYSNNSTVMACSLSDAVSALRDGLGQGHQSEEQ